VRDLRRNVRLVFYDSQWFLGQPSERARTLFLRELGEALITAGDRQVVILAHHPFATAGPHGIVASGPASVGAVYLLAKSGALVQDLNSPAYGSLRDRMRAAFAAAPRVPLVYAAGHDHSLQVIDGLEPGDPRNILVSGSASKLTSIGDTTGMRYGAVRPGYMMLVFRTNDSVDLYVTAGDPDHLVCPASPEADRLDCMNAGARAFELTWSETLPADDPGSDEDGDEPITPDRRTAAQVTDSIEQRIEQVDAPPRAVPDSVPPEGQDSVLAAPGRSYDAGPLQRALLGDLNRDLWEIEITAPVLALDTVGGGFVEAELSGTDDAPCLELRARDGTVREFRPLVKNSSAATPELLQSGDEGVQDPLGAQFPVGTGIAASLMQSADVLVSEPRLVVMPDDPRLGQYREVFGGRMGWVSVKPAAGPDSTAGFAGSSRVESTPKMLEALRADATMRVDERAYLRARLVDMLVNDWHHPSDVWRWAAFTDSAGTRWEPIPGECEWAFARADGIVPRLAGAVYPEYTGFSENFADVARLMRAGSVVDRRLLGDVDRVVFVHEATAVREAMSDAVIDEALARLPSEYPSAVGEGLRNALRARRDALPDLAQEYYRLLTRTAEVFGTLGADSAHLAVGSYSVTLTLLRGEERIPGFTRTFRRGETSEVRVHLIAGEDVVTVSGDQRLPMKVRLIGEPASVRIVQPGRSALLAEEGQVPDTGDLSWHETEPFESTADTSADAGVAVTEQGLAGTPATAWETRDWGSLWLFAPAFSWASEYGLHLGARASRLSFGFRQIPWESSFSIQALASGSPFRFVGKAAYERKIGLAGYGARFELIGYTERHSRFFGLGNQSQSIEPESFYTASRPYLLLDGSLAYHAPGETWSAWIGPRMLHWGPIQTSTERLIFDESGDIQGSSSFTVAGLQAGFELETMDDVDLPRDGTHMRVETRAFPGVGTVSDQWVGATGLLRSYHGLPGPLDPILHLEFRGERVWGSAPYPEMAALGGRESLPGYRSGRFMGNSAVAASALVRVHLFDVSTLGGLGFGTYLTGAAGRVWLDDLDEPRTIHSAWGPGVYLRVRALDRSVSFTLMQGGRRPRTYVRLGLPF
jgi:hypothetical protein